MRLHLSIRHHSPPPAQALVYELLDAHADTVELAAELAGDLRWDAHLEYLRALQRTGHAMLARGVADDGARFS